MQINKSYEKKKSRIVCYGNLLVSCFYYRDVMDKNKLIVKQ